MCLHILQIKQWPAIQAGPIPTFLLTEGKGWTALFFFSATQHLKFITRSHHCIYAFYIGLAFKYGFYYFCLTVVYMLFSHYFMHHYNTTGVGWKKNSTFSAFTLHNTHTSVCARSSFVHRTLLYLSLGSSPFKFSAVMSTPPFRGPDPSCWTSVLLTVFWVAVTVSATDVQQNKDHTACWDYWYHRTVCQQVQLLWPAS